MDNDLLTGWTIADFVLWFLPDAKVLNVDREKLVLTIDTIATGKEIFDVEAKVRRVTEIKWELMCGRKQDENKLRVKLAKFRGIGDAT